MESAVSSDTSVSIYQTPWRHIPKALIFSQIRSEGLPSQGQTAATSCMDQEAKQQALTKEASSTAMRARQKNMYMQ
jgi:hypothetical protein